LRKQAYSPHTIHPTNEGKVKQGSIVSPQPINYYVSRRHYSLVDSPIGIRIMVCWDFMLESKGWSKSSFIIV
jgi:hypothetical protein